MCVLICIIEQDHKIEIGKKRSAQKAPGLF